MAASVMIYHVTHRPFWNAIRSAPAFVSTALGAGSSIVVLALLLSNSTDSDVVRMLACATWLSALVKLATCIPVTSSHPALSESLQLLATNFRWQVRLQTGSGLTLFGMGMLLVVWPVGLPAIGFASVAVIAALCADFTERYLFFRAVVPLRMPGVPK